MSKKIIMLSQAQCPKCVVLDHYLSHGLNNKYEAQIEVVTRENDPKRFMALARQKGILATPALIAETEVLLNPDATNTLAFLEKHV